MRLRGLSLEPAVMLAPMAGFSDSPLRTLAREAGCALVFTEMVSAEGLLRRQRGSRELLRFSPQERPIFAQLFGREPERLAAAAEVCAGLDFDGVDLNLGCPMRKIVGGGAGAALMREPERAERIVSAMRRVLRVPLTVKMRAGWSAGEKNAVELARRLEGAGADAVTLHPRTRDQFYGGAADWSLVATLVRALAIPVVGNGDVRTPQDAERLRRETGCAGVMIGRAALGNPWIFSALAGRPVRLDGYERLRVFHRHLEAMVRFYNDPRRAARNMRKHLVAYTRGLPGGAALRVQLQTLDRPEQLLYEFSRLLGISGSDAPVISARSTHGYPSDQVDAGGADVADHRPGAGGAPGDV
ncbi:MAG: tRNA dihydrouridine synthase DusB [Myxococcales bacterium]|nr:tRNA dihydrouridine synthase DusB [Myxococcales bacterium]